MLSAKDVEAEFEHFQTDWHELRPFLVQYLPGDKTRLNKADRLFAEASRRLKQAVRAEGERRKLLAFCWYVLSLRAVRRHSRLVDVLGERGLQIQEEAEKRKVSA